MGVRPPVPPEDIDTKETVAHVPSRATDEQFLARQKIIHAAVLECIHNLNSAVSMAEKWKILEHMVSSVFQCHSSHLYVIDATRGHLVRFASKETEISGIGAVEEGNLENRYSLADGTCVYGNVGAVYRGYAIDAAQSNSQESFIASNKLEDDKFISYAPAKSVMVVPFLSSAGSIHGCIECSSVEDFFSEFDIGTAKLLALHISMFLTLNRRHNDLAMKLEGKGLLLAALKPENLAELSLPKLLKSLTIRTKDVLKADRCIWYILDKDRGLLWSRLPNEGKK